MPEAPPAAARQMLIRDAAPEDAPAMARIYAHYVCTTTASLEETPPDAAAMAARLAETTERYPWLVAVSAEGAVEAYAYAGAHRSRAAYRWAAEVSVYAAPERRGQGLGRLLYDRLHAALAEAGYVHSIAVIALPNPESIRFHERCGFRRIGRYDGIAYKFGKWIDVEVWRRPLMPPPDDPPPPRRPRSAQTGP